MAHVRFSGSQLRQLAGGVGELEVDAATILALFRELGRRFPALVPLLDDGVAVAIDGQIYQDTLTEPIPPGAEVFLLPKIAGG